MMKKLATGVVAGSALALALTACGSPTESPKTVNLSAHEALNASAGKTANVESFSAELTVGGGATVHGTGSFQIKPAPAFSVELDQISLAGFNVGTGGTRLILLGQDVYVSNKNLNSLTGGSKPWVKVNLGTVGDKVGFNPGDMLKQVTQANPADLAKIVAESTDVKKVGTEKIDGVQTTHYAGTVDLKTALKNWDPELQGKVEGMAKGAEALTFDFWADKDQLPRKVAAKATSSEGKVYDVTVLFRDYGKKVSVTAPPADQVGDLKFP
ncbi:LppX_LprAFG lipoprotein [Actinocorallia longicatena]|uniref:Lipoprotein n=1 Tax=Actinocorallia longicatena TaxID=111803 RepID=A0ABP6QI28_9ACTN